MLQNYAANLRNFEVDSSAKVHWEKISKDTWKVDFVNKVSDLRIRYQYYANQLDAGGSMLNDQMLYISPINCLMYIEDFD